MRRFRLESVWQKEKRLRVVLSYPPPLAGCKLMNSTFHVGCLLVPTGTFSTDTDTVGNFQNSASLPRLKGLTPPIHVIVIYTDQVDFGPPLLPLLFSGINPRCTWAFFFSLIRANNKNFTLIRLLVRPPPPPPSPTHRRRSPPPPSRPIPLPPIPPYTRARGPPPPDAPLTGGPPSRNLFFLRLKLVFPQAPYIFPFLVFFFYVCFEFFYDHRTFECIAVVAFFSLAILLSCNHVLC